MKQNTFVRHLFALFIAFSFIPMFLSGNDFREANNDRQCRRITVIKHYKNYQMRYFKETDSTQML